MAEKHYKSKGDVVVNALEEAGYISDDMLKKIQSDNREAGQRIDRLLVDEGYVSEGDVLNALAHQMGMEVIDLADIEVDEEALRMVPSKVAKEFQVFPVKYEDDVLTLAIADPLNVQIVDDVKRILNVPLETVVAPQKDIELMLRRYYEKNEIKSIITKEVETETEKVRQEQQDKLIKEMEDFDGKEESSEPVVRYIDKLLQKAYHDRASDIHVEPQKHGLVIRFRVDGVCHTVPAPPKALQKLVISRLKVMSGMDPAEKRIPQDGRIKLTIDNKKLDLRVNSLPAIFGESVVMRILDQSSVLLGLGDVGFLPDSIRTFEKLISTPNGVILMTGPTGSGKTTTLYSALSTINTPEKKIITVEHPVEYQIEGINQIQVNHEIGLDFAAGLRAMLRQSPDVIMVGEIRDLETAEAAVEAALTGHLVFSTLHTNDAPSAPARLVDMGIKPFLVASGLQAVIAQRLVRRICNSCREEYEPKEEELAEFGISKKDLGDRKLARGKGCDKCADSGYRGRSAIHEILVLSSAVRQMIIRNESASRIKQKAVQMGMRTLRMDGWEKVMLGMTTTQEVLKITQND